MLLSERRLFEENVKLNNEVFDLVETRAKANKRLPSETASDLYAIRRRIRNRLGHKRTQSGPPTEGRLRDYDAALTAVIQRNGGV